MIRPYLSALGLILIVALLPVSAQSQTAEQLLLLQSNPGLASELQGMTRGNAQPTDGIGVPTADGTEALNAQDAIADPDLLLQSTSRAERAESVIQHYYRILTGDILDIYGADEFAQQQDNQLLFFNTMGKDYRLAAGDVIRVTLRGLTESDQSLKIGRDGNLILPSLPPILVSGFTIAEVEEKLLDILRLDDASASAYLSLETARLITVQISGAVNAPRTLAVPAYTPLSRVLAYAGGIKPTGSLRNIILRERDGSFERVDFYDFLQSPIGANDPIVSDSARIFVGNQGPTVAAQGFVARPGIYELSEGARDISVEDLLALSGTSIIPPGLEIEAIHFDETGTTRIRPLTRTSMLQAGEVLNLRFVETRLQEAVTVMGAVLDEYSRATSTPLSVSELLKNGATLAQDARLDFALIIDKTGAGRAIDLRNAIFDPSALVAPGSTLVILDQPSYRRLVTDDPNATNDPLTSVIQQVDLAEIYLDGNRIAYLPPTRAVEFADLVRPYYAINTETNLDIILVERADLSLESYDLRSVLQKQALFDLNVGDRLHFFNTEFLSNLVQSKSVEETDIGLLAENQTSAAVIKLINSDAVLRVRLDGNVVSFLSKTANTSLADIVDILGVNVSEVFSDTVGITDVDGEFSLVSLSTSPSALQESAKIIDFLSPGALIDEKFVYAHPTLFENFSDAGVSIYLDGILQGVSTTRALSSKGTQGYDILTDPDVYPYFSIFEAFIDARREWERVPVSVNQIVQNEPRLSQEGSKLFLLSRATIADLQETQDTEAETQIALANAELNLEELTETPVITTEVPITKFGSIPGGEKLAQNSAKFIGGAVGSPGAYPIVGEITLQNALSLAGGLTENADLKNIQVQKKINKNGILVNSALKTYDLTKTEASSLVLADRYTLNIPPLVNDAEAGIITINGEVQRPGDYVFSRDDTLHDIIERAGGLTSVAYPLGSIFTREGLKDQQRATNKMLANQLDQAVLQLSQSDREGAADQISAVLSYAEQLRLQDVTGRLSVNILMRERSSPVYLQSGDTLTVPKRPSHISVIGSVQNDTAVSYRNDKALLDYVQAAGGYTKIADIKRTYILLPNGENTMAGETSIIPPGSVIVVPPKVDRLSALGLTDVVSRVLGNIATSILAINNVR